MGLRTTGSSLVCWRGAYVSFVYKPKICVDSSYQVQNSWFCWLNFVKVARLSQTCDQKWSRFKGIWLFKAAGENFLNLGQNMQAQTLKHKRANSSRVEQPSPQQMQLSVERHCGSFSSKREHNPKAHFLCNRTGAYSRAEPSGLHILENSGCHFFLNSGWKPFGACHCMLFCTDVLWTHTDRTALRKRHTTLKSHFSIPQLPARPSDKPS